MGVLGWILGGVVFTAAAAVLAWLGSKDRRWLFVGIAVFVILPLLWPTGLPKVKVTAEVRDLYEYVEELPPEAVVLLSTDYDPGSKPELHPMTYAVMDHLCRRKIKFAISALWPAGPQMANEAIEEIAVKRHGLEERVHFAHLGYKTGQEVVIQSLGNSLKSTFPTDVDGVPIEAIPFLQNIGSVKDFAIVITISAGTPGTKEWVQQAGTRYEVPIASGCTGVQATQMYPYYPEQLVGLLGGMAAAAEYERLLEVEGRGTKGMEAQSFSHALIFLFVVFGNIVFFVNRSRMKRS